MQHIGDTKLNCSMPVSPPVADPYQQGSIEMALENADLWKTFNNFGTEMIIAKHGRRMFPHCTVSLSGLQPYANYVIMVDMIPVDGFRYKWYKDQWEVAGKAEPQPPCRTYLHPDSPAPGSHWMKQSVSLLKLKLTNNTLDQHGYIILHSMHRYYPRVHVIQADSPYTVCWGHFQTFTFPETTFTAVTAYQNTKITKLKIDHNPFAKGFREEGTHSHSKRCRSKRSPIDNATKAKLDRKALYRSPPGIQRAPYASQSAETRVCQGSPAEGHLSPWTADQDPSQSLHIEPLELTGQDYSSEEQMVPASMANQPYRSAEYSRLPSPFSATEDSSGRRSYESHVPDVATVPRHDATKLARDMASHHPHQHHATVTQSQTTGPCQEYRLAPVGVPPMPPKSNPGILGYSFYGHGHGHGHYPGEQGGVGQWCGEVETGGQYLVHAITAHHPPPPPSNTHQHPLTTAGDHQRSYHHHGNTPTAEWSQYPLFSYSRW